MALSVETTYGFRFAFLSDYTLGDKTCFSAFKMPHGVFSSRCTPDLRTPVSNHSDYLLYIYQGIETGVPHRNQQSA